MTDPRAPAGSAPSTSAAADLVEGLFRTEYAKLVAVLTGRYGLSRLGVVEDLVQETLIAAMHDWSYRGVPDNPAAWLTTVAKNKAKNVLKHEGGKDRWHQTMVAGRADAAEAGDAFLRSDVEDAQLRMMFACCHEAVARADQLALVLKILCGFSAAEIGHALLLSPEAVDKRLYRARRDIRDNDIALDVPGGAELEARLSAVCQCIYLLFNEGYAPSASDEAVRRDLCTEAIRLGGLLAARFEDQPPVFALLALMLLHAARFDARVDAAGEVVLLEDQDRSRWDQAMIQRGLAFLAQSATGGVLTPFHLEASIAAQHCLADSLATTNWALIETFYRRLQKRVDNPLLELNLAIVTAQRGDLDQAISMLQTLAAQKTRQSLARYPLLYATLAELCRRAGRLDETRDNLAVALRLTTSARERATLMARLDALDA